MKRPRIFISYSHHPDAQKEVVDLMLARLRGYPLEVHADTDNELPQGPQEGWITWMREQIDRADWILAVCSPPYRIAWEKKAPQGSRGATYESALLLEELYRNGMVNRRIIPVVPPGVGEESVPRELRDYTRYQIPVEIATLVGKILGSTWLGRFVEGVAKAEGTENFEDVTPKRIFEDAASMTRPSELPGVGKLRERLIAEADDFYEKISACEGGMAMEKLKLEFRKAFCPRARELFELAGELPEIVERIYEKHCLVQ
jgi:hypothetical protein